jgi:hypothetical protein
MIKKIKLLVLVGLTGASACDCCTKPTWRSGSPFS